MGSFEEKAGFVLREGMMTKKFGRLLRFGRPLCSF
jgi:hypothetical protein